MKKLVFLICLFSAGVAVAQTQAIDQLVYEIRNPQTDAPHFRKALSKIGEYLALNVLEELNTKETGVETLTGKVATHRLLEESPVLVTILRAGLPLNDGVQRVFPHAEVGFIAMSRNEETLKAQVDYIGIPCLQDQCVILSDTMLGTGGSIIDAITILQHYKPKKIFVIAAVASVPGIARIKERYPEVKIFAAVTDPALNDKGYILPGLGDAGDRAYGKKCHLALEE